MRWVLGVVVCLGCVAAPSAALADVDPAGYTVAHQPQIGSCGNVWAKATFTRTWTLKKTGNSRDVWTIDYSGNFTTQAGPSAGACNPVGGAGIVAALHGKIGSHATIHVPHPGGPTFSPLGVCQGECRPSDFIAAFYPPGTTWTNRGPGGAAYFHFRPGSPWLPLLCAPYQSLTVGWDQPGWVPGSFINWDIATTC